MTRLFYVLIYICSGVLLGKNVNEVIVNEKVKIVWWKIAPATKAVSIGLFSSKWYKLTAWTSEKKICEINYCKAAANEMPLGSPLMVYMVDEWMKIIIMRVWMNEWSVRTHCIFENKGNEQSIWAREGATVTKWTRVSIDRSRDRSMVRTYDSTWLTQTHLRLTYTLVWSGVSWRIVLK